MYEECFELNERQKHLFYVIFGKILILKISLSLVFSTLLLTRFLQDIKSVTQLEIQNTQ